VTTSRFGSGTISRDSKGATTTTQHLGDGHHQPQQFGRLSNGLALCELLYDLAEQRARWGRGVGCAGIGAVPLAIWVAHFLILFDTELWV
jgi:hypothetical protein